MNRLKDKDRFWAKVFWPTIKVKLKSTSLAIGFTGYDSHFSRFTFKIPDGKDG